MRFAAWGAVACLLLAAAGCADIPLGGPHPNPIGTVAVDEAEARALISAYRTANGLSAVDLDPGLVGVAQQQADAMASANILSHEVAGSLPRRLANGGIDRRAAIENVSAGYATLASALSGWKRSPEHNKNLLFGPMRRMGIAAASAPNTRYKTFWSLVMTN